MVTGLYYAELLVWFDTELPKDLLQLAKNIPTGSHLRRRRRISKTRRTTNYLPIQRILQIGEV